MPGVTTAYQDGIHSARPAANAGCILYACSTHSLIYRSDGSSWTTWMTIGSTTTTVASDAIWDAKGDLAAGTGADTASKLTVGANDTILMADSAQSTGLKWVGSQTPSTQAFGDAAAQGTADTYARGDHLHAMPAAPVNNIVATSQTLSGNNSWVDLATTGPALTVTVGASGVLKITLTCHISGATNGYGDMGFAASGANTIAAGTANKLVRGSTGFDVVCSATFLLTGLTPGSTTFTAKYNQQGGGGTTTWSNREMIIELY